MRSFFGTQDITRNRFGAEFFLVVRVRWIEFSWRKNLRTWKPMQIYHVLVEEGWVTWGLD